MEAREGRNILIAIQLEQTLARERRSLLRGGLQASLGAQVHESLHVYR
jgi:hypothetical protein